jgi:quercetin dioxygenase-like cupin family protein
MIAHDAFSARVLLRGEQSGGALGLVDVTVPAHWEGPPLHRHAFDETFYVLAGELTFQVGEALLTGRAGQCACVPGDAVHTVANLSDAPARYLLAITPAGFEHYFDRFADEAPSVSGPVPATTVVGPRIDPAADRSAAAPLRAGEGPVNVLVRGADSGGRIALMDNDVAPGGAAPPLHYHAFDEAFYVRDGELTFQLGDERVVRRPGELAFAERGVHHTFANLSGAGARVLIICTPAGFERYFQRIAARIAGVDPPAEALEPWPEVVTVGPPLAP